MIYIRIRIPLLQEGLRRSNEFISELDTLLDGQRFDWNIQKDTVKIELTDRSYLTLVEHAIMMHFLYVGWHIFDEEHKVETINHITAGKLQAEYKLPLFPEDYKF